MPAAAAAVATLFDLSSFHLLAIVLVLFEAVTDSVVDSFVCIIAYPVYYHLPAGGLGGLGGGALPYLGAYLLPPKRVYRVIVILYVPVLCLWRARHKVLGGRKEVEDDCVQAEIGVELAVGRDDESGEIGVGIGGVVVEEVEGAEVLLSDDSGTFVGMMTRDAETGRKLSKRQKRSERKSSNGRFFRNQEQQGCGELQELKELPEEREQDEIEQSEQLEELQLRGQHLQQQKNQHLCVQTLQAQGLQQKQQLFDQQFQQLPDSQQQEEFCKPRGRYRIRSVVVVVGGLGWRTAWRICRSVGRVTSLSLLGGRELGWPLRGLLPWGRRRGADSVSAREDKGATDKGGWGRIKLRHSMSWGEMVHLSDGRHQNVLRQYNSRWTLYRRLPLRALSRLWGRLSRWQMPTLLRWPAFRLYIWLFGCVLSDAVEQDLVQYRSFSKFFQRVLRPGVRPISKAAPLTSPADGTVLHCGAVCGGVLEQVKGVTYSLRGFLGPQDTLLPPLPDPSPFLPARFYLGGEEEGTEKQPEKEEEEVEYVRSLLVDPVRNCLHQCIVYLAPGDYHHFHSPTDWTVFSRRHFPGELFSVNPSIALWLQGLFNFNERALYAGRWKHGFFSMTAVGATNVGSICVPFDPELSTNCASCWDNGCFYDASFALSSSPACKTLSSSSPNHPSLPQAQLGGVKARKGREFGEFNLGSTIVLLFEAPRDFEFSVRPGQKVKYGEALCHPLGSGKTASAPPKRRRRR